MILDQDIFSDLVKEVREFADDCSEIGDYEGTAALNDMAQRLDNSQGLVQKMYNGSKREKALGSRIPLENVREIIRELTSVYEKAIEGCGLTGEWDRDALTKSEANQLRNHLAEIKDEPGVKNCQWAEALRDGNFDLKTEPSLANTVAFFRDMVERTIEAVDCEPCENAEAIRKGLVAQKKVLQQGIDIARGLVAARNLKPSVKSCKTLAAQHRGLVKEVVRSGLLPQTDAIEPILNSLPGVGLAFLLAGFYRSPVDDRFNFERILFENGTGTKKDLVNLAMRLYGAYKQELFDEWRKQRLANGEPEEKLEPWRFVSSYKETLGKPMTEDEWLVARDKARKEREANPPTVPPPEIQPFEAWAWAVLDFEV